MAVVAPVAFARELGRTLNLLAKTARARRIYQSNNAALQRMQRDLAVGFETLLRHVPSIELRIRPSGMFYEDICVLDTPNPDESLAFAFYRDGIRRLGFQQGIRPDEVEALIGAAASGFIYTGLGEDTVTYLWRHDLEHIQYLVVDTTIVDATEIPDGPTGNLKPRSAQELDGAIDGLLRRIYGERSEDVGVSSFTLDRSDIAAKAIAEQLDRVDEMAPGFHPLRRFNLTPAYAREVLEELERETDHRVSLRAAHAVLHSVRAQAEGSDEERQLYEVLLRMYDAALIEENLRHAGYVLAGVARCPSTPQRTMWLQQALDEARLRQVAQNVAAAADRDLAGLLTFFRACGQAAVTTILAVLPSFQEPSDRRALADLAVSLGIQRLELLQELLHGEQNYLAQEALYILGKVGSPEAQAIIKQAEYHLSPQVRITLLRSARALGDGPAVELGARLIEDLDARVRVAAAELLTLMPSRAVGNLLEARLNDGAAFEKEPAEVKRALLVAYATSAQTRALPIFNRIIKRGDGLFTSRTAEEGAMQAILAVSVIRAPRTVELLKRAAVSRSKRVRETARQVLENLRRTQ